MPYDPDATRARILDAATEEFAGHGLAGARVDRIAAAAGCSKERLYAHVGDKTALFETVLHESFASLGRAAAAADADTVEDFAVAVFDHIADHPANQRLLDWARLEREHDWSASVETLRATRDEAVRRLEGYGVVDGSPWSVDDVFALVVGLATAWVHLPAGAHPEDAQRAGVVAPVREHQREVVREAVRRLLSR